MGDPIYKRKEEFTIPAVEWQVAIDYFKAHPSAVKLARKDDPTQRQQNSFVKVGGKVYALSNTRFLKKFGGQYGWVKVAIEQPSDLGLDEKPKYVAIKIEGQDVRGNLNPEAIAARRAGLMKGEASRTVDPNKIYKTEKDQEKFGGKEFKLYTVLEWLEGDDLDKVIENNPLTDTQRWLLSLGAAVELMRLQNLGIVHGDVKASNFRAELDAKNNPKRVTAMDYGFSKIIPEGEDFVTSDYQDGSPGYKAPEISDTLYFRTTDNYALAVTFLTDTHLAGKMEDWLKEAFTEEVIQAETSTTHPNLIAFLENNLQEDGTVRIPEVLRPYMGGESVLKKR